MKKHVMRGAVAALLTVLAPAALKAETSAVATSLPITGAAAASLSAAAPAPGRTVLVDAASARLFMMQDGQVVDSMRVIVGKAGATPTLSSTLHYATLNPFWYVPPDLARRIIAPNVLKDPAYLDKHGYEVVSGFRGEAELLAAEDVDWQAVASGQATVFVRQRPGPTNSMGRMKFGFGDVSGIFLHDTPKKDLFAQERRDLSNGCVRLEDAPRLARWLLGKDPDLSQDAPEQHVALAKPVSIVITYLDRPAQTQIAALR